MGEESKWFKTHKPRCKTCGEKMRWSGYIREGGEIAFFSYVCVDACLSVLDLPSSYVYSMDPTE